MIKEYRTTAPRYAAYTLETEKLDPGFSMRLVVASDLHGAVYGDGQDILVRKILAAEPDMILMPGDMIESMASLSVFSTLLRRLRGIPVLYVTGNHEMRLLERDELKRAVNGLGATLLPGKRILYPAGKQQIMFYGIDDVQHKGETRTESLKEFAFPISGAEETERLVGQKLRGLPKRDTTKYNVLLTHRPEHFLQYDKADFDLVVAGHAHGGQWRIPGLVNGLYAPNQGVFPKYAGGRYDGTYCTMIVSRGLSNHTVIPRFFNSVELPVITLRGKQETK